MLPRQHFETVKDLALQGTTFKPTSEESAHTCATARINLTQRIMTVQTGHRTATHNKTAHLTNVHAQQAPSRTPQA